MHQESYEKSRRLAIGCLLDVLRDRDEGEAAATVDALADHVLDVLKAQQKAERELLRSQQWLNEHVNDHVRYAREVQALRAQFAGAVLGSIVARFNDSPAESARAAVAYADTLLAELGYEVGP